jgi:hypothetical protein
MALMPSSWEAEAAPDPMALTPSSREAEAALDPKAPLLQCWEAEAAPGPMAPLLQCSEAEAEPDPKALRSLSTQIRGVMQCSQISERSTYSISLVNLPAVDTTAIELCLVRLTQCV